MCIRDRLHSEANPYIYLFYPQGLDADLHYEDIATGKVYTGAALMKAGLPLPPVSYTHLDVYKRQQMCFTAFDNGITHFDLANNYGPQPGSAAVSYTHLCICKNPTVYCNSGWYACVPWSFKRSFTCLLYTSRCV